MLNYDAFLYEAPVNYNVKTSNATYLRGLESPFGGAAEKVTLQNKWTLG